MPKWASALLQGSSGTALAVGILGILRPGTDRWLGIVLIGLSIGFLVAAIISADRQILLLATIFLAATWIGGIVCVVLIVRDASKPAIDYASAYDDTDPGKTGCDQGAHVAVVLSHRQVTLRGEDGQPIGVMQPVRSTLCATIWPHVRLDASAAHALKGRILELVAVRPADGARAPYPLPLRGGQEGFGNQLGATSCIEVQAHLLAQGSKRAGPTVHTRCS